MSQYAKRLNELSQKRRQLIEQEKLLIEKRKKEIGVLAEKLELLTIPDDILIKAFQVIKHEDSNTASKNPSSDLQT
jgi:hypothetical protein